MPPLTERRRMSRGALLVFVAVLVTGALTVGGADGASAGKFRVVIEDSGSVSSFKGRFVLYAPASADSGTSALQIHISPVRYRGGQRYDIHSGVDTMDGKKGELKLTFSGPSVNAAPSLYIEYGTGAFQVPAASTRAGRAAAIGAAPTTSRRTTFSGKDSLRASQVTRLVRRLRGLPPELPLPALRAEHEQLRRSGAAPQRPQDGRRRCCAT